MSDADAAGGAQTWFVGRDDVLDAVLGFVDEPGRSYRLRAGGTWGIGKTWLLKEIGVRSADRAVVLHIKVGAHQPAATSVSSANETLEVVRNWNTYTDVVIDLIRGAPQTEEWGVLAEQVRQSQQAVAQVRAQNLSFKFDIDAKGDIEARESARIASPTINSTEPVATLEAKIEAERAQIERSFASTVDRVGRTTGAVILVDEFDRVRDHLVGDWLLRLVSTPEHVVVVIGTRFGGSFAAEGTREFERADLRRFGDSEINIYLTRRLGADAVTEPLVDRVFRFSDGLPQAVAMAADLIEQRRLTGGDLLLNDVRPKPDTATTELLSTIVREVPEDDVRTLLKEGRFARRIDADVIHYLLHGLRYEEGDANQRQRADNALEKLREYSFVEDYDGGDDGLGRYRFHEYITRAEAPQDDDALRVYEEGVHTRLAAYLERRHDKWDEEHDTDSPYRKLYKLESRDWQALAREWIYHMSHLDHPETRERAELAFVRVFLQTFWWWGCYVGYEYCAALLADWEALVPRPRVWTPRLHELLNNYPIGYVKLDKGNWGKVDQAMRALRDDLHVEGNIPLENDEDTDPRSAKQKHLDNRRLVRALTSLFRAHSWMYRTGAGDLARPLFDDALKHFRAAHERSAVAWTTFELAELEFMLHEVDTAVQGLREAARLLADLSADSTEDQDYELLANIQRLHGDIASFSGDDVESVDAAARAVLRAYAFLNEPEPPDPYTVAFYNEIRERAAQRLLDLRARNGSTTAPAASRLLQRLEIMRRPFGLEDDAERTLETGDRAALVALLPPPPTILGEEARADEVFATTAARVLQDVLQDASDAALAEAPT